MNIFKLISIITGTAITLGAAYHAQKKIHQFIQSEITDDESSSPNLSIRTLTVFAVTVIVGGTLNHIINNAYPPILKR